MTRREYNTTVKNLQDRLFGYVLKSTYDSELSKDVVQDSFLKLWQYRQKVEFKSAKSWLFITAHNTLINYLKKNGRLQSIETSRYVEPSTQDDRYEWKDMIDQTVKVLPQLQKSILLFRDLEGYSYKEIGAMLNLNESQVKVYLFRARQKVKNALISINKHELY